MARKKPQEFKPYCRESRRGPTCDRCLGNGEVVTDWDRYLKPQSGDVGDEAVAECPDCLGSGYDSTR